eukprot:GHVT01044621.1.p1 GENE.GHVT01044621.1~~GHVT01044621.1.p1  ORF type:complete len:160 (+),score=17.08 GHVT01044621.1:109-588(+)
MRPCPFRVGCGVAPQKLVFLTVGVGEAGFYIGGSRQRKLFGLGYVARLYALFRRGFLLVQRGAFLSPTAARVDFHQSEDCERDEGRCQNDWQPQLGLRFRPCGSSLLCRGRRVKYTTQRFRALVGPNAPPLGQRKSTEDFLPISLVDFLGLPIQSRLRL